MAKVFHRIVLEFPSRLVDQPIIYKLVEDYKLVFNILKAYVTPDKEGRLVLELSGEDKDYKRSVKDLKQMGVKISPLSQDIIWNKGKCTHCGACISVCPTNALSVNQETRKVEFLSDKCIACLLCIPACPVKAIEVHF